MKKKILLLTFSIVMILLFVGCSPKTAKEACEKADKKVSKMFGYESSYYDVNQGTELYVVELKNRTSNDMVDKEAMIAYASVHAENVFDEVEVVLKDFPDVMICVSVLDEDDEIYYLEIDREVQFNWYDEILYDEYF